MDSKELRKYGVIMLIAAGVIYAIERIGSIIAQSREIAAMYAIHMFDGRPKIHVANFSDNAFVPILAIAGVILFASSFVRR